MCCCVHMASVFCRVVIPVILLDFSPKALWRRRALVCAHLAWPAYSGRCCRLRPAWCMDERGSVWMSMDRQLLSSEGVHQEGKGRVDAICIRDPALDPDIQLSAVPGVLQIPV